MSSYDYRLGLIGAGNMAEAIARGAIERGVLEAEQMVAADPTSARREVFEAMGVACVEDGAALVERAEQVVLAIKPQMLPVLSETLKGMSADQTLVSIMAGVSCGTLEAMRGGGRVVRVMPNTPLMVGRGMSAVALGSQAKDGDDDLMFEVLSACGEAIRVEESQLDAVTAVSGSGPAYGFLLAEAMRSAAVALGVGEHAEVLVTQTLLGAAEMMKQSGEEPAELRRKVTSPGGTTQAAIEHFQAEGFERLVLEALTAARDRSVALGSG